VAVFFFFIKEDAERHDKPVERAMAEGRRISAQSVRDVVEQLERLTEAMRRLLLEVEGAQAREEGGPDRECGGLQTGHRVRVILRRDRDRGRVGTIVGPRGTQYWNIMLDGTAEVPAKLIYKRGESLSRVE
jgi:hypothetical protein